MLRMFLPNHLGLIYTGGLYCNATIRSEFDFPQKSRIFSFYMWTNESIIWWFHRVFTWGFKRSCALSFSWAGLWIVWACIFEEFGDSLWGRNRNSTNVCRWRISNGNFKLALLFSAILQTNTVPSTKLCRWSSPLHDLILFSVLPWSDKELIQAHK